MCGQVKQSDHPSQTHLVTQRSHGSGGRSRVPGSVIHLAIGTCSQHWRCCENGEAITLSPSAAMAAAGGPRKRTPPAVAASAVGSSGFSEAWPLHMGYTAFHLLNLDDEWQTLDSIYAQLHSILWHELHLWTHGSQALPGSMFRQCGRCMACMTTTTAAQHPQSMHSIIQHAVRTSRVTRHCHWHSWLQHGTDATSLESEQPQVAVNPVTA